MTWTGRPSAVSYIDGARRRNVPDVTEYIALVREKGNAVSDTEALSPEKRARETAIMNLRMTRGIETGAFLKKTGYDVEELFGEAFGKYSAMGLIHYDGRSLSLTTEGFCVANEILADFV